MQSCKATWSLSNNPWAWARLPLPRSRADHEGKQQQQQRGTEQGWHQRPALPGVTQQDKDCWARSRQQVSLLESTSHPVLQNQATWSTSLCKMLQRGMGQGGDVSVWRHYVTKTTMFPFALRPCRAQEIAPSQSFYLPHPSGRVPKLVCAVLQQAVECFFRDLSLGWGSWVLQQWNCLSPWLATPLGTAPHLALTKVNTHNSPKTNTGVTIRVCDYHSQVITTTLHWASPTTPLW